MIHSGSKNSANLVRRPIPDSFILMAPKDEPILANVSSEDVLGSTEDSVFLMTDTQTALSLRDSRTKLFPNYEYSGELFDSAELVQHPLSSSLHGFSGARRGLPRPKAHIDNMKLRRGEPRRDDPGSQVGTNLADAALDPPDRENENHLDIIDIESAWAVTQGSPHVVSAITDSGLELDHPLFANAHWNNPNEVPDNGIDDDDNGKVDDLNGWDFTDDDNDPTEELGRHHTHIFGLVHGEQIGVAPEAKGMSLRIGGGERRFSSAILVESYLYALENGAKSINTSFNIDGFVGDRAIEATYRELADQDVLLFNSAGNKSRKNPKRGAFEDVALVGSTETLPTLLGQRSDFSNYGSGVDIAAPGSEIVSSFPGGRKGALSGTSMASPLVMGVDLLLQSAHPDWNREQRWAQIAGTADPLDEEQGLGHGRLNAGRALTEDLAPPTVTPRLSTFPNGQTMDITIQLDSVLDTEGANHNNAWQIVNADGEVVRQGPPKEVRLMTNKLKFNVADLPKGQYTLRGSAEHLTDPFGQALDANKDGIAGDDLVIEFQRIS